MPVSSVKCNLPCHSWIPALCVCVCVVLLKENEGDRIFRLAWKMLFTGSTWEIAQGTAKIRSTCRGPAPPLLRPFSPLVKVLLLLPAFSCIFQAEWHGLLLVTYQVGVVDYEVYLMGWCKADLPSQSPKSLWRDASVPLVFMAGVQDELGLRSPKSTNQNSIFGNDIL